MFCRKRVQSIRILLLDSLIVELAKLSLGRLPTADGQSVHTEGGARRFLHLFHQTRRQDLAAPQERNILWMEVTEAYGPLHQGS